MSLLIPAQTNVGFFDLETSTDGGTTWTGWMLARDRNGAPMYREDEQDVLGGIAVAALQSQAWSDFSDGMGLRLHRGAGEGIERRYFDVAADAEFGGLDASVEGVILLPQKMTATTVYSGAHVVRAFCYYPGTGKYYAGIDDRLYESANGTFADAVQVTAGSPPTGSNILDMIAFQGNSSVPLLYIAYENYPAQTWDGGAFRSMGHPSGYDRLPTAVYFYDDSAGTYTDYTAATTDDNAATAMDIGTAPTTMTSADSIILGYSEPFLVAGPQMGAVNGNAATLTVDYWNGSAWAGGFTVGGGTLGDTTSVAGAAFAQQGSISWARPAAWTKAVLTATGSNDARYYVRIKVSATLDTTVTIKEWEIRVFGEASAWATRGKDLGRIFDRNRLAVAEDGGYAPTWNTQPDPAGDYAGSPVGLVATNDSWFFKSTTGFHSWTAAGEPISYLPDLAYAPESSTARGFTSWAGLVWTVHGGMWRFDPVGGVPAPFGPEVLGGVENVPTFTSLVGDRDYALYGCGLTAGGTDSWLWKYTGVAQDGKPRWHKQQYLGAGRTIYASATWTVSGQPYLLLGDGAGKILCRKLAKTGNPLDAGSGADYQDGVYGYLQFATFEGAGGAANLVANAASLSGRNIDSASNLLVLYQARAPQDATTAWSSLTRFTATSYGRSVFATPYAGLGIDQRLGLRTSDTTKSPAIEGTWLHYVGRPRRALTAYRLTLLLSDGLLHPVHDRSGAPLRGQDGLLSALVSAEGQATFLLRLPGGGTDTVRAQGFSSVLVPTKRNQPARRGVSLTLSSVA